MTLVSRTSEAHGSHAAQYHETIRTETITGDDLPGFLHAYRLTDTPGGPDHLAVVIVEGLSCAPIQVPSTIPALVIGVSGDANEQFPAGDLVVPPSVVDEVVRRVERTPIAALSLAGLLRAMPNVAVDMGLMMESSLYSTLQGGSEFARWRDGRVGGRAKSRGPAVLLDRDGDDLTIMLNRPERHNAITSVMRDELVEALELALIDDSIRSVILRGAGPSFCSGGDLDEFGSRPGPATAHLLRTGRSPAQHIDRLRERIRVEIHGVALGGGIEMAAFAGHVSVDPDSEIGLPELDYGLIPGAGGTVSLTARIGRQRTALLALGGLRINGRTAVDWGLADELRPHG